MKNSSRQNTLKAAFSLSGKGLHTGQQLKVTFSPAPENFGYKIQRIDLEGQPMIDAVAENVVDTSRGTVVAKGDVRCSTIEHGMAALYAMGIDNCLIQVDGPEFPILDGSAKEYVAAIEKVGIEQQQAEKDFYVIKKKVEFVDEQTGSCITLLPDDEFSITSMINFNSRFLGAQFATLDDMAKFGQEVASARTFVFVREILPLLGYGLIKGGDLDNAIVIYDQEMPQEDLDKMADTLGVPHHDAKELCYMQTQELRWENEPARHKLLDIIGDMALIGRPIKGRIIATRPGHTINNKFARQVRKEIAKGIVQAPSYDPNQTPLMDNVRIKQLLPHRYPMQLVDKVIELGKHHIVGVKNITANEAVFQGHFPNEPVFPGVLQIEAMAQVGGLFFLSTVEDPENYSTYFLRIDDVKFRRKVVPGDTLIYRVDLISPIRHGIATMRGYGFVGETMVIEATFTAQVSKNL